MVWLEIRTIYLQPSIFLKGQPIKIKNELRWGWSVFREDIVIYKFQFYLLAWTTFFWTDKCQYMAKQITEIIFHQLEKTKIHLLQHYPFLFVKDWIILLIRGKNETSMCKIPNGPSRYLMVKQSLLRHTHYLRRIIKQIQTFNTDVKC